MLLLIGAEDELGREWLDHPLKGEWQGFRECHIGGNFLLIYQLVEASKMQTIIFTRMGSHSDLFES